MSSSYVVSNNGISTLAGAISSSTQTSITVTAGHGVRFPSPTGGDYTLVTLENAAGTIEIVSIVGRATDTLTVGIAGSAAANSAGRGMEGTTATTWAIGDIVEGRVTAAIAQRGGNAKTVVELAASSGAALIGNAPAGSIAATTVQAAINELDTEKAALNGNAANAFSGSTLSAATTIGVGAATPAASGAGITFPATQSASSNANTLDDYEEGTWTPVDSSGAGLAFTGASGFYTKIGRSVQCRCVFTFPTTANGANVTIGGLPFVSGSYGNNSIQGIFVGTATITTRGLYNAGGTATFSIDKNNGAAVAINSDFSACLFYGTLSYEI